LDRLENNLSKRISWEVESVGAPSVKVEECKQGRASDSRSKSRVQRKA
jgi:hypothetical protein